MNLSQTPRRSLLLALGSSLVATAGFALSACTSAPAYRTDGAVADWGEGAASSADAHYLYTRFSLNFGEERFTPQSASETTRIAFDLDQDAETGKPLTGGPYEDLGIDLEIVFSPPADETTRGGMPNDIRGGSSVVLYDADGGRTIIGQGRAELVQAPTHVSDWYEARIARTAEDLAGTLVTASGEATSIVLLTDERGTITAYGEPDSFAMPAVAAGPRLANVKIPSKPRNAVRVMSLNVLRNAWLEDPEPFGRMIEALRPDIVLFQEAWDLGPEDITAWLNTNAGGLLPSDQPLGWYSTAVADGGVAIASPHPIAFGLDPALTVADPGRDGSRPVRAAAALVSTPLGDVLAASVHLKCCGGVGGREDAIRTTEAAAIRGWFDEEAAALITAEGEPIGFRVIGGDYNLVGSKEPLLTLSDGMAWAQAAVLGDAAEYTWREERSSYAAGRLDWIVYNDAHCDVVNAFSLDTRRLSDGVLRAAGLEREDGSASDHLPLVVDLRPR